MNIQDTELLTGIENQGIEHQAIELLAIGLCEYTLPPKAHFICNTQWTDLLGYQQEELPSAEIFLSWWGQQIHPDDHTRVIKQLNQLYSGKLENLHCEFRIRHKLRHWLCVAIDVSVLERDSRGWAHLVLQVMQEVRQTYNRYQEIVDHLELGLWVLDRNGVIRFANTSIAGLLGYAPEEMVDKHVFRFEAETHHADRKRILEERRAGKGGHYSYRLYHRDGYPVDTEITSTPVFDLEGNVDAVVESITDISVQKQHELKLRILSSAVEQSGSMVVITDADGDVDYVNNQFCENTGYSRDDILKQSAAVLKTDNMESSILSDMMGTVTSGQDWHGEFELRRKNGEAFWTMMTISPILDEHQKITHYVSVIEDVSRLKEAHMKMEQLAYVDSLTGLANRLLFRDRLEQVLKLVQRNASQAALLYLDLDQFKRINDSLGHDVGDALLMKVAERLRQCVRHQDTVARMGGDEFVILLSEVDGYAGASSVARKILEAMRHPMHLLKHELIITPSIGITIAPDDTLNPDIMLKNADMAMYKAKSVGRNNFQFFTEEMNTHVVEKLLLENELRKAIAENDLRLVFQPQMSLKTSELVGVESLVRWQHRSRGLLGPNVFIPVAEETGLVVELGEWVLRNACREWHELEKSGVKPVKLAVNLSARQFMDPNLIDMIQQTLDITHFKPINLELEITETTLLENIDYAVNVLGKIKQLGISISIDDFGTGYSSLNYLKRLPIDSLKIDQAFVKDIPSDKDDMEIASAVIAMAHKLHLKVVAEGVSTQAQWAFLKKNKCDVAQGYLMGQPMTSQQFLRQYSDKD